MLQFQLFRMRVMGFQMGFDAPKDRAGLLKKLVESVEATKLRKGAVWHLGNVTTIDAHAVYFRLGVTRDTTIEVYKDGDFFDKPFARSPYTHCMLDTHYQVCAIARKSSLAPKTTTLAKRLARLLRDSALGKHVNVELDVSPLQDPESFITYLKQATVISRFTVTFSRRNLWDAESAFIQPLEKALTKAHGDKGKAEMSGEELDAEVLESISRSAAASGDQASAYLQPAGERRKTTKKLRASPVVVSQEDVQDGSDYRDLAARVRSQYKNIRGGAGGT